MMRIISLLILASLSFGSYGIVLDPNSPIEGSYEVTEFDPSSDPVTTVSVLLEFQNDLMDTNEAVKLRVFNKRKLEVGSTSCTNTRVESLSVASCLQTTLDIDINENPLSFVVESTNGSMDVANVGLTLASAPSTESKKRKHGGGSVSPVASSFIPWAHGIVYTRQDRVTEEYTDGNGNVWADASNTQQASDVVLIHSRWPESDVVYDDLQGNDYIVYDCTTSVANCAAQDPRVSPDGTKVVFSVTTANEFVPFFGYQRINSSTSSQLYLYDLQNPENAATPIGNFPGGQTLDRHPDWLNNSEIVFSSNRDGHFIIKFTKQFDMYTFPDQIGALNDGAAAYGVAQPSSSSQGLGQSGKEGQVQVNHIWKMNIDGTGAVNLTPHETRALRPTVLSNGDIVYSSLQWSGGKDKVNKNPTPPNAWWIARTDSYGGDHTVVFNAHRKSPTLKSNFYLPSHITGGEGADQTRALRGIGETVDGRMCVQNYYRRNHRGQGNVYCLDIDDPHIEGAILESNIDLATGNSTTIGSGGYTPSSLSSLLPYGNSQDIDPRRYDDPTTPGVDENKTVGKGGYYHVMGGGRQIITHVRGLCYEPSIGFPEKQTMEWTGGEPNCDSGIWEILGGSSQVTDPFDTTQLVPVIDHPEYHEFDSAAVTTYQDRFGQSMPTQQIAYTAGACYLEVADATEAELVGRDGYTYNFLDKNRARCVTQGCAVNNEDQNYHANNIVGIKVFEVEQWDSYVNAGVTDQFRGTMSKMGWQSVIDLGTQSLEADGSVKVRVPCETPILIGGVDDQDNLIAIDLMAQSLRSGESRKCHGCHARHSEEAWAAGGSITAATNFSGKDADGTFPSELVGIESLEFYADIAPILDAECKSCHAELDVADPDLYSKVAMDPRMIGFHFLKRDVVPGDGNRTNVEHVWISNGGSGYIVGEVLVFPAGSPDAQGEVSAVDGSGSITDISLTAKGSGYNPGQSVTVNTAEGSGAVLETQTEDNYFWWPQTSKLVSTFGNESLLFWACMGSRQDGRTNAQYVDDIDFDVPAHPSAGDAGYATVAECNKIARWIDQGAYGFVDPTP